MGRWNASETRDFRESHDSAVRTSLPQVYRVTDLDFGREYLRSPGSVPPGARFAREVAKSRVGLKDPSSWAIDGRSLSGPARLLAVFEGAPSPWTFWGWATGRIRIPERADLRLVKMKA